MWDSRVSSLLLMRRPQLREKARAQKGRERFLDIEPSSKRPVKSKRERQMSLPYKTKRHHEAPLPEAENASAQGFADSKKPKIYLLLVIYELIISFMPRVLPNILCLFPTQASSPSNSKIVEYVPPPQKPELEEALGPMMVKELSSPQR